MTLACLSRLLILQQFQCAAKLVGTGSALGSASDAIELSNHIVDVLAAHQLGDALQVAVATAKEKHLLDDVVVVAGHINQLRACACSFILYVLHNVVIVMPFPP